MKKKLLENYQGYYISQELGKEIFKMTQKEDKNMEYYVERFQYNL